MAIAFWILAVVAVGAALMVVWLRDIFRAALCLILCFLAIAGIYVTLNADFLAAAQVLVYVGAIAILILFAIMLTRQYQKGNPGSWTRVPAFFVAGFLMLIMVASIVATAWGTGWPRFAAAPGAGQVPVGAPTTGAISRVLFGDGYVILFEIAGVLLLAVVIGALVIARPKE